MTPGPIKRSACAKRALPVGVVAFLALGCSTPAVSGATASAALVRFTHSTVPPDASRLPPSSLTIGPASGSGPLRSQLPTAPKAQRPPHTPQRFGYAVGRSGRSHAPRHAWQLHYHGGLTMTRDDNFQIYWEPPTLQDGSPAATASNYNARTSRYFRDVRGSGLYNINTQYGYRTSSGRFRRIRNASRAAGYVIDTSPFPPGGCLSPRTGANCLSDHQVQAEIRRVMSRAGWRPSLYSAFFVYTPPGESICRQRSCGGDRRVCAYHSSARANPSDLIYAAIPYPVALCLAGVPGPTYAPSGVAATDGAINLTSHEQMEAVTDPYFDAWFGLGGTADEIGDKCEFRFGPRPFLGGQANQEWNGDFYIAQMEWDNSQHACRRADVH